MKRLIPALLCLCLLLTACAGNTPPETTVTTAPTTEATTEPTTEPTTVPTTEPPVLFRHPLTGAPLDEPWTSRITAVVINNIAAAMPQHGVSAADIIYEVETEGGITRCLALFSDFTDVGSVGPVRSARTFFNNIALSYEAPLVHCGGSAAALRGQHSESGDRIDGWEHIDESANGSYFFRDKTRLNNGYSREHTLFSNGELLAKVIADKKMNKVYEDGLDFGLLFDDEITVDGETANKITVRFLGTKTTTMNYNEDTGLYEASQYNTDYIDGNTNETMTFTNVLTLYTKHWRVYDGYYYRSYYNLVGEGDGHFAYGGQIVPIKWHRDTLRSPFYYTLADGTPLTLCEGKSYIAVASVDTPAQYE